ncbi:MAG: murein biosynthesis integral membrane protein MurJ [Planctomycetota bacterium]|nr:murein biosynthesis integral membrane protein MurJ [Planctomycetota bacterium]
MNDREDKHSEHEHFFGAARVVAGLTMLSRVLGMVRDMAIWAFGATRATDAFWTAFSIPNLFRRLFGEGALSAAFVPVFTEVAEAEGWEKARLTLANLVGLLAIILAGVVVLCEAGMLVWLVLFRPEWDWALLLKLTMIVLPFMFTICLLALGSAALNCKGHFAYPAFAPILLNVFLIAAAFIAHLLPTDGDWRGLFILSVSVVAAGIVQLVGVVWLLRSVGLVATPRLRPVLPSVRRIARLALPMMIPLGVLQFSAFFDRFYAWLMSSPEGVSSSFDLFGLTITKPLDDGVVTCLYAANRLYQFPLGILAISLATVVFPLFSRYAARNDAPGLRKATNQALRMSLFMGIPAGLALIILAEPVIILICGRGKFMDNVLAVRQTTTILRMYCLGMWAYFCNHILLRAFFAQKDARTPLRIACILVPLNMVLVIGGIFTPLKSGAIGAATAATSTLNAVVLVWVLHRRLGGIDGWRLLISALRTAVACAVMVAVMWAILYFAAPAEAWKIILFCVPAGAAAFLVSAAALRCPELPELLKRNSTE